MNNELNKKILAIRREASALKRSGKNTLNNYEYSTEQDVLDPIGELMNKYGLILIPEVIKSRKEEAITKVEMFFKVVDTDSGESMTKRWLGWGLDKQDKGGYKAYTGATKYFLMKLFGLSFKGDDPEANGKQEKKKSADLLSVEEICKRIEKIRTQKTIQKYKAWVRKSTEGYTPAQQNVIKRKIEEQEKTISKVKK